MNVSDPEPNRHPETRRSRRAPTALLAFAAIAGAAIACEPAEDAGGEEDPDASLAVLEQELGAVDGPPEQAFASIGDFLITAEGEVWVLDGIGSSLSPRIRRYDTEGGYLGDVGREGGGPGEFRRPYALAQLPDGRVVVRDQLAPDRLLLFGPNGAYDTTWTFEHPLSNVAGNPSVMRVGESGVLWVEHRSGSRPDPTAPPEPSVFYARIAPEGTVLDTVVPPAVPEVEPPELLAGLIPIPFQPRAIASWTPWGSFATGRTDAYHIRITRVQAAGAAPESAGEGREAPSAFTISRPAEPVRVGAEEAEAARAELLPPLETVTGGSPPSFDIPERKPPLRGATFDDEGRLWVHLSVPARPKPQSPGSEGEGEQEVWAEPDVHDVYEPDGELVGRVELPWEGCARRPRARGDELWCQARGPSDVEVIRRYRIEWK